MVQTAYRIEKAYCRKIEIHAELAVISARYHRICIEFMWITVECYRFLQDPAG